MADALPLLVSDVGRWYAATTLAIGIRTGLAGALLAGGGSAGELAARARVDAQNAAVWADAMVSAGYARRDGDRYVPDEDAIGLLRGGFPFDLGAVVGLLAPLGGMVPRVEQAVRGGGGISSHEIQEHLGVLPEQVNGPMYERHLVAEWIAAFPELEASLRSGIDVAEIGPGGGQALRLLAAAFPASRFVGYDLDPQQVGRATAAAAEARLPNLRFETRDAADLAPSSFDLVCAFDTFHHFGRPDEVADAIVRALRGGGSFLVAEASLSGDPMADASDPLAVIMYASNLLYCFQESKAEGGAGLGVTWAPRHLESLLSAHGFTIAGSHESGAGYVVTRAVRADPA
jgi:SAM-dependent methyltransferase